MGAKFASASCLGHCLAELLIIIIIIIITIIISNSSCELQEATGELQRCGDTKGLESANTLAE